MQQLIDDVHGEVEVAMKQRPVEKDLEVEELVNAMLQAVEVEGGVMAVDVELEVSEVVEVEMKLEEVVEVEVEAGDGGGTGGAIGLIK